MESKYDNIGTDYNLTRKADPYLTAQMFLHLGPRPKGFYLDIGCGTGNYTIALHQKGYRFIGIDPSQLMLDKAKVKCSTIDWRIGMAEQTVLAENSVDGILGSLTIHHWKDLHMAFKELSRVLKPNGRIVLFTSTPQQMKGYWLNHYFPKMLKDSIVQMPELQKVKMAIVSNGFEAIETHKYVVKPDLEDQFLYCGKHNPELYFDAQIRHGISSFSSLSNKVEVKDGLSQLRKDIDGNKFQNIKASYKNDLGDYLFIIGRKRSV